MCLLFLLLMDFRKFLFNTPPSLDFTTAFLSVGDVHCRKHMDIEL